MTGAYYLVVFNACQVGGYLSSPLICLMSLSITHGELR